MATPVSDCVRDPRIRRTRQLLQGAMLSLMKTKPFDEISVQDIADAATVNRATFYDHYTDKYALLESTIASGFHQMLHHRQVVFDGSCPAAASAIILAACDYLTGMQSDSEVCNRQSAFEPLVDAAITAAIRLTLVKGKPALQPDSPTLSSEMIASAASSAIYGAVKQWSSTPNRPSAEEIVPGILQLVLPILGQQSRPTLATAELVRAQ
jgi:AcrR family transcriptional regulator